MRKLILAIVGMATLGGCIVYEHDHDRPYYDHDHYYHDRDWR